MAKRSGRGRQQPHSKKPTRTQGESRRNDDIDWNISSDEAEGEENLEFQSVSDNSEEEVNPEDLETAEERKMRALRNESRNDYSEKLKRSLLYFCFIRRQRVVYSKRWHPN